MARLLEFNEEEAIRKAMEVFWSKGYNATSMRDLTSVMQINSSSLYNTIGDKHQLFVRCIKHYTDMRIHAFKERYSTIDSAILAIETIIKDAAKIITTETNSCMCVKTTFEIESDDQKILAIVNSYDNYTHQFLEDLISKAQVQGELANTDSADTIANYLNSIFIGWYHSFALHKDIAKINNMADLVIKQLKK